MCRAAYISVSVGGAWAETALFGALIPHILSKLTSYKINLNK